MAFSFFAYLTSFFDKLITDLVFTVFTTLNITPTPGEKCSGVLDGNKISMTCENGTFGYGEIKGKTIYITNHKPFDEATCKITVTLIE